VWGEGRLVGVVLPDAVRKQLQDRGLAV
jgi:hypothetical protein